ncbi:demethoxyubiquinone hydroxylase family protein [Collimonas pratensis]|uniref:demethoxyubiquinone hydroxylase family protein n=1 Tax=Collimonas pratensis TaxID=279113 RepID=UPI001EEDE363|nr:demethoxyubiquinone hydroxylase family protein [Collimonas pratensis]
MKVDHAGEHGAVNIYAAQIFMARFTAPALVRELLEFKSHEEKHRSLFSAELQRRGLRRCRSYWFCGVGGFILGLFTGLLGVQAISATTASVERVVLKHLQDQLISLASTDDAAVAVISKIVAEEQQHHDLSLSHLIPDHILSNVINRIVTVSTESVIWIGMRT